jgi:hypothetical protein
VWVWVSLEPSPKEQLGCADLIVGSTQLLGLAPPGAEWFFYLSFVLPFVKTLLIQFALGQLKAE